MCWHFVSNNTINTTCSPVVLLASNIFKNCEQALKMLDVTKKLKDDLDIPA
jgi:hypothetical protein